jgi:TolB-like protein/DNA-binding winged helix-turn-helix (wHTH) protein
MGAASTPSGAAPPARFRFADLTLDIGQRRLARGTEQLPLSKLTFALLRALVEAAPNVVSHEELAERVWGPRRVVTPENVAKRVMRLREALGDDAGEPRYVEGLRGQGYRLIPRVELAPNQSETSAPIAAAPTAPATAALHRAQPLEARPFSKRWRVALPAGIALAAMLGSGVYLSPRQIGGTADAGTATASATPVAAPTASTKIVVVPFVILSSDPEQHFVVDGLTDELILSLQRLPGVQVTGRTTSFALRDSGRSTKEIAAELGVNYVLEGSVGSDGERLRVRAQLSDASGFGVVPYSYEGALENVFKVQDDIVGAIATALRAPLGFENAADRAGTQSLEAYELYIAAVRECAEGNMTPEGFERALRRIDRAVSLDPKFARAWMFKSNVHTMRVSFIAQGAAAELAAAEDAATRALGLAPDSGDGYHARALLLSTKGDWAGAFRDYRRAQALGYAGETEVPLLLSSGRIRDARARVEKLLESDQLNEDLLGFLAVSHEIMADPAGADDIYRRGTLLYDPWQFGDVIGMWIRLGRERSEPPYDEVEVRPPFVAFTAHAAQPDRALALLESAAHDPASQAPTVLGSMAVWAAHYGDERLALELLSRSLHGSTLHAYIAWLPVFADVRRLPEFKQLVREIGLVDYWRATGWPDVCRPAGSDDFDCA